MTNDERAYFLQAYQRRLEDLNLTGKAHRSLTDKQLISRWAGAYEHSLDADPAQYSAAELLPSTCDNSRRYIFCWRRTEFAYDRLHKAAAALVCAWALLDRKNLADHLLAPHVPMSACTLIDYITTRMYSLDMVKGFMVALESYPAPAADRNVLEALMALQNVVLMTYYMND